MTALTDFLLIWAAVYGATVLGYFGLGLALDRLNRRHPERRIQPKRRGEDRARIEIVQSLKSLVVTCGCLAGGLWAQAYGFTLWSPLALNWWSAIGMFLVSILLFDAWFYWGHRLMHWRPLYRHHLWHHRSVAPTVWSNYSDSLADAFAMQSYYLIAPMLLPIPAAVLIAHRVYDHVNGMIGHSGFEYFADRSTRFPSPFVCTTFHDQHHERFGTNYANFFSAWDRICGTLAPDYDEKVRRFEKPDPLRSPAE
ncbi:sterol desaturase family protein [Rubrimonas cliftonensis]|uniref:Sterol desaturase/sphingolipid hydroxylase, fatty acid hydroxylase superfamily n=1 Tax=Rubrimonas cliftonensis TaxID=89524 RepID=A0A1H3VYY0_9RHOB|nr:sterol desaturase family protein [Rubrimonas cliftonensis]SDZ80009.1 Sterol desaturase/sphingolipid hydroxylase, fatty acid hydroxylase superfamily [Rubrimonas cliftonensis]